MTARPEAGSSLSIVLPCLDEAERLPGTLAAYLAHFPSTRAEVELIVVDDGSTDGTTAIADQIAAADPGSGWCGPPTTTARATPSGSASRPLRASWWCSPTPTAPTGPSRWSGSWPPSSGPRWPSVPAWAASPGAARRCAGWPARCSTGSCGCCSACPIDQQPEERRPFADTQRGLTGFRRDAAEALFQRARVNGFAFDAEALLVANRLGLEVVEVPVTAEERQGSKVRLRGDALAMLADVWKVRRAAARGAYDETRVRDVAG